MTRVTVRPGGRADGRTGGRADGRTGGRVELFYDSSLDTFSNTKGKYTLTCTKFQRSIDPVNGRIRFLVDNCRGGDVRALVF